MRGNKDKNWGVFSDIKPGWELGGYIIKTVVSTTNIGGEKIMVIICHQRLKGKPGSIGKGYLAYWIKPTSLNPNPIPKTKNIQNLKPLLLQALSYAMTTKH